MQRIQLEFELGSVNLHPEPLSIILHAHPSIQHLVFPSRCCPRSTLPNICNRTRIGIASWYGRKLHSKLVGLETLKNISHINIWQICHVLHHYWLRNISQVNYAFINRGDKLFVLFIFVPFVCLWRNSIFFYICGKKMLRRCLWRKYASTLSVAKKCFYDVCGENMLIRCLWRKNVFKFSVAKMFFLTFSDKSSFYWSVSGRWVKLSGFWTN